MVAGDPAMKDLDDSDLVEILALVEAETAAWLKVDIEAWADCWMQSEEVVRAGAYVSEGVHVQRGFTAQRAFVERTMQNEPARLAPEEIRRENLQVRISGDMAWTFCDQIMAVRGSPYDGISHQMRVLERHEGRWKFVFLGQYQSRLGHHACPWVRVGPDAKVLDISQQAQRLLQDHGSLCLVGGRLCGRTSGDNRILRAALDAAGDPRRWPKDSGTFPLLFTHAEDGILALCWISTRDNMVVVLLDDDVALERKLTRASHLYALSPGQVQVARQIACGADMRAAAQTLGVRPSTVRTHIQRMFDKLGVSSRPALVRMLLSVDAPGD